MAGPPGEEEKGRGGEEREGSPNITCHGNNSSFVAPTIKQITHFTM
jgi:hypothetical protein